MHSQLYLLLGQHISTTSYAEGIEYLAPGKRIHAALAGRMHAAAKVTTTQYAANGRLHAAANGRPIHHATEES